MVRTSASTVAQFIPVDIADIEALFTLSSEQARVTIDRRWRALGPEARIHALGELRRTIGRLLKDDAEQHTAFDRRIDLELVLLFEAQARHNRDEIARRDRLNELGQLSATLAHELRGPLGVIESSVYLIHDKPEDPQRREKHLGRISDEVRRAKRVVDDVMSLIQRQPAAREPLPLGPLVAEAIALAEGGPAQVVCADLAALPMVVGHRGQLSMALGNLVRNAKQFALHTVRIDGRSAEGAVELAVSDDGPGVAAAVLPTLFEPLSSARAGGTGLGLALVRRVAEHLGGSVRHEPVAVGTRFVLRIPAVATK